MKSEYVTIQFDRFDSKTSFLEVCECYDLDKIRLGFRTFDQRKQKGNRVTASIDIYLSMRDANELSYQIQAKHIAKAKAAAVGTNQAGNPLYTSKIGGSVSNGNVRYRDFSIYSGSKADYAIGASAGEAKQDEKGLIQKVGKPDTKIFIPLSEIDLRAFANALKRAVSTYDMVKAMEFYKLKASIKNNNR